MAKTSSRAEAATSEAASSPWSMSRGRELALGGELLEPDLARVEPLARGLGLLLGGEADPVEIAPLGRVEAARLGLERLASRRPRRSPRSWRPASSSERPHR
jgi:hypothetical protein